VIRAVLDTNVIVSGILSPSGSPGQVLQIGLEEQRFQMVTSVPILGEIDNVLRRPQITRRHGWTAREISVFLGRLFAVSLVVEGRLALDVIAEDPSDNMFLAAAQEGEAGFVVSGDAHLQRLGEYRDIVILPPQPFLVLLHQDP
jgi:uncharacterized protein